ncbi:MAG: hypothetical protein OXC40_00975 [Proteobacteria bacterium]|nr:hypothetical protein [Pseudomonadota bacterium]
MSNNFSHCITGDLPSAEDAPSVGHKQNYYAPDGQQVEFFHRRIESSSELQDVLKLEAGFSSTNHPFTGKTEGGYNNQFNQGQNERYFFYSIKVENPRVVMKNIKLSKEALHFLKTRGEKAFLERCGTEAEIGYQSGGSLSNVIRMSKKDESSKDSIDSLIKASGFGFDLGGMILTGDHEDSTKIHIEVYTKWRGGMGEHAYTSIQDLRKMSEKWPATVAKHGVVLKTITMPFEPLLKHLDDPYENILFLEIARLRHELRRLTKIKNNLLSLAIKKPQQTQQAISALDHLIIAITKQIRKCETTTLIERCQNTSMILKAKNTKISINMTHHSCGVKTWHTKKITDLSCGYTNKKVWRDQHSPICPVASYNTGVLFKRQVTYNKEKTMADLTSTFDPKCDDPGIKKTKKLIKKEKKYKIKGLCMPVNPECLSNMIREIYHYTYELSCYGESAQFGIASFSPCLIEVVEKKPKTCLIRTQPMEYNKCLISLDQDLSLDPHDREQTN